MSALYALARKPWPEFSQAIMMDLRGKSCAEIKALFAPPSLVKPTRKLMTILVPRDLSDAARRVLIADVAAALARITEERRIDLDASLPANSPKVEPMLEARLHEEQPAEEPSSDDAEEKLIGQLERAAHDIESEQQSCPEDQAGEPMHALGEAGLSHERLHEGGEPSPTWPLSCGETALAWPALLRQSQASASRRREGG